MGLINTRPFFDPIPPVDFGSGKGIKSMIPGVSLAQPKTNGPCGASNSHGGL